MPIGSSTYYQEMLDNAKNYNKRICIERRQRLPFLDSQTGVAQSHSGLCIPYRYRGPGRKFGQIYTYPSRRWKKKSSIMFNEYPLSKIKAPESEAAEENPNISSLLSGSINNNLFHQTTDTPTNKLPNYAMTTNNNSNDAEPSVQQPINPVSMMTATAAVLDEGVTMTTDWDVQSDGGEVENLKHQSDSSDYEETYVKKRKKGKGGEKVKTSVKDPSFRGPKRGAGKGRVKKEKEGDGIVQDKDKPYSCEFCPMKYKTRPGLSYHMNHSHNKSIADDEPSPSPAKKPSSDSSAYSKKMPMAHTPQQHHQQQHHQQQQQHQQPQHHQQQPTPIYPPPPQLPPSSQHPQQQHTTASFPGLYNTSMQPPPPQQAQQQHSSSSSSTTTTTTTGLKQGNKYCDFCLGDENENKKTGFKEEMVSCADCGRSGHPSCLQFSANMIISVKRYPWQCIECKSCGICGTSDNDDQLLFCDDCDRGYHMYCLKPPLSEPPEGSWSCHLCLTEFYSGSKDDQASD